MEFSTAGLVSRFFFYPWKKTFRKIRKHRNHKNWAIPEEFCRRFSLAEIIAATESFNDKYIVGGGAHFSVYRGHINNGATIVAIKRYRGRPRDFTNEVQLLCQLRHPNLVRLIGFCQEKQEHILVCEYVSKGPLSTSLFATTTDHPHRDPVPWKQRLNICIGLARALHYLHAGVKHVIVHRDVNCTVVLLDQNLEAKLTNLGTFKVGPPSLSNALIRVNSGRIVGTPGYIDPESLTSVQVTEKSDVYSFGMVLLEVLCAKWAQEFLSYIGRPDTLCDIMDPFLMGKIAPHCLNKFMEIIQRCVRPTGAERPTMGEVEVELECTLELQESADAEKGTCVGPAGDYSYQGISFCEINDIFSFLFRQQVTSDGSVLDSNSTDLSVSDDYSFKSDRATIM